MGKKECLHTEGDVIGVNNMPEVRSQYLTNFSELVTIKPAGIGIMIISHDGKVLIGKETEDKLFMDKKAGDWSIPFETVKAGETDEDTLRRTVKEETGEEFAAQFYDVSSKFWLGDYQVGVDFPVWGRVFVMCIDKNSWNINLGMLRADNNELLEYRWVRPGAIRNMPRRRGIWEMARDLKSKIKDLDGSVYIRGKCVPGFRPNQV
ncbi:MAG: NUDIX hydrolase [Candidatus Shapirobacteria bacterium]|nr:NUDIX hydrolase [Candidatus Shapirobacteria bacterium]